MWKKLTYKGRVILLLIGIVISLPVIYNLSLRKTFELKAKCREAEEKLEVIQTAPEEIVRIRKELNRIDNLVGKKEGKDGQEVLIEQVSDFCQKRKITFREYPGIHEYQKENYNLMTNVIKVKGAFKDLVELLYDLEKNYKLGKVTSVKYQLQRNYKTKKKELIGIYYIQNIRIDENE